MDETTPNPDTAARLRRAITRLNRRLRSSSLGGLTPAEASILALVDIRENPSLGELAAAELIQPPSVTRLIRSMEESGLVTRTTDPQDRRCTRVSLTARGRRKITEIRERKTAFLEQRLQSLSGADQRHADELVGFLERLLEET